MSATALEKLSQSFLKPNSQLQGMSSEIDLATFNLQMRTKAGINIVEAISDAEIDRTIEGASTLTVTVQDDNQRTIQLSGKLGRKVDVEIDGLFFTLVGVTKTGRVLNLKFEEREINVLRYYGKYLQRSRDNVTRAQFVLLMLKEVKEIPLRYVIPELTKKQAISDIQPNQILVNAQGTPLVKKDTSVDQTQRPPGIFAPAAGGLTVKGQPATVEQLTNANTILQTGTRMGARRKVLVCSIMTAIDESTIHNLTGGDRDSVGIFQQRASQGWPATRDIPTDAAAFFQRAIQYDAVQPTLSYNDLCQAVQHSGTPTAYGQYQAEAEAFVNNFGVSGGDNSDVTVAATNNNQQPTAQIPKSDVSTGYFFTRGNISTDTSGQTLLTKENSWQCITRLASEVNWRAFCVSGAIYFISDEDLFASAPFMNISEDDEGIDTIDYDFDEGKRVATVTVTCHLARWSAPPGSTVQIHSMGPILDGKWLVNEVSRSLYQSEATITLKKPQPVLPEPTTGSAGTSGNATAAIGDVQPPMPGGARIGEEGPMGVVQAKIVGYAQSQIGVPYGWGKEDPGVAFDCSGLAQAAMSAAGVNGLPRVAQDQFNFGPKIFPPQMLLPGDLVFFGAGVDSIEHVGIYIGNGKMIDAPQTGEFVRVDENFTSWTNPPYVAASRPWAAVQGG